MKKVRVLCHNGSVHEFACQFASMNYDNSFKFQFKDDHKKFSEVVLEVEDAVYVTCDDCATGELHKYLAAFSISSIERNGRFYTVTLVF